MYIMQSRVLPIDAIAVALSSLAAGIRLDMLVCLSSIEFNTGRKSHG